MPVKTKVFGACMTKLASELNAPVMSTAEDFRSWGQLPFFQELRLRRNDSFSNVPGVKYAKVTVDKHTFLVGPFRTPEACILDEELCEARESLPPWTDGVEQTAKIAIEQAFTTAKTMLENESELEQKKMLLEFLHAIGHIHELHRLLQTTVQFLVQKFRLSNAVIKVLGAEARYFDAPSEVAMQVEQRIVNHVQSTRAPLTVQNVLNDFLLDGIEGKENLPQCISAFPLERGYVVMYAEQLPELTRIGDVLRELAALLHRVTAYEKVQESAVTDALTKLYNRNQLVASMDKVLPELAKQNKPISIILFDVDNFKNFNDTKGHPEGDKVLQAIADVTRAALPQQALTCRYGGEEFIVLLPNMDQYTAKETAEKLRIAIAESCPLTVSMGVMTCANSSASREKLISEADRALYRAKHLGKNRVVALLMLDKHLGVIDA